jgi:hypothetical protein
MIRILQQRLVGLGEVGPVFVVAFSLIIFDNLFKKES